MRSSTTAFVCWYGATPRSVRLFTWNGHDWTGRFPLIARAALALRATTCLIDGEAVACGDDGLPVFDQLRYRRDDRHVFLYAFDLMGLDGDDLRTEQIEARKAALAKLIRIPRPGPHRFGLGLAAHLLHVIETWGQYRTPTVQHFQVSFSHGHERLKEGVVKKIEVGGRELKSPVRISGSGQSRRLCSLTKVEE